MEITNGYKRSLVITVTKYIDGVMADTYPRTYNGQEYLGYTDDELAELTDAEFAQKLSLVKAWIQTQELGMDFNNLIGTGSVVYDPTACEDETITTTTTTTTTTTSTTTSTSSTTTTSTTCPDCSTTTSTSTSTTTTTSTTIPPETIIFAVSQRLVLRSTDLGENWSIVHQGLSWQQFYGITFISSDVGFVFGAADSNKVGAVLKTTDGGLTWVDQAAKLPSIVADQILYRGTKQLDTHVYAAGTGGVILLYNGGNDTWYNVSEGGQIWSEGIHAFSSTNVIMSAQGDFRVLRTSDSGNNWSQPATAPANETLSRIAFNGSKGFIASHQGVPASRLYVSTDSGATWNTVLTSVFGTNSMIFLEYPTTQNLFIGGSDIYATQPKFWVSSNGGSTWLDMSSYIPTGVYSLWSAHFIDENTGWVGTGNGRVMKTSNGGLSWTVATTPAGTMGIQDIYVINQ